MRLDIGPIARGINPGEFFNIRCTNGVNPILRRPLGLHRIKGADEIEVLYKVVGEATRLLSKKKKGNTLDMIGPLGNGFPTGDAKRGIRDIILVAGGHGVAPLVALAEEVSRYKSSGGERIVIIGARTKKEVMCEDEFKYLGFKVLVTTEDGSKGRKGFVTRPLKIFLEVNQNHTRALIYACGPNAMLKEIKKITSLKMIEAFGSFEEHLACGTGSCYGCTIKTKKGYKRVCKDGPVFNLREVAW